MRKLYPLFLFAIAATTSFGQDVHRCYTHEAMMEQEEANPGYMDRVNEIFDRAKAHESFDREDVYTIPVVVHVVHNTSAENIPDSVVYNQIEILNADFRRLNEDADNVRDTFNTIVSDTHINFQLASIDPDGNPTTGITRTYTEEESFLSFSMSPAEGVKQTETGGIDPWDQDRYLNIWVCDMSLGGAVFLLGYATPPDGLPHWPPGSVDGLSDGVVVQYEAFGSNNPTPLMVGGDALDVRGRTTVHEVGHYLGLRHIWGDGDCEEQDGVDDTPNAVSESSQDCDITKNTCVDDILDLGDLPDMVENFMDYSAETCQNSFTMGQTDIMRGVLEVERFDLVNENPALRTDDEKAFLGLDIYPNPATNSFTIELPQMNSEYNIQLMNEMGQVVLDIPVVSGISQQQVEVNALAKGVYFVAVRNAEGIRVERLVIQ